MVHLAKQLVGRSFRKIIREQQSEGIADLMNSATGRAATFAGEFWHASVPAIVSAYLFIYGKSMHSSIDDELAVQNGRQGLDTHSIPA